MGQFGFEFLHYFWKWYIEPVWLAACNIMMAEMIKGSKQL